jgi:hypothetical protein
VASAKMRGPDPPQDVSMEERVAAGIAVEASSSDGKGGGADRIGSNKFVVAVSGVVASSSSKSLHAASYEADDGDDGSDGSSGGGSSGGSSSGGSSSGGGSDAQSNATGTSVDEVDDNDDDDDDNESCCSVYETDEVALLGEIVSGFRLTRHDPGDDVGGDSDDGTRRVFCRIRYGSASVHRTECAKDSGPSWRNPIWTLSTQSLFVIHTTPRELAHTDVVVSAWFQRRDPLILTNETSYLGEAKLTGTDLVRGATEERVHSLTLHDGQCHKALDAFDRMSRGTLNVRFRLATPADEAIVKMLGSRQQSGAALAKPGCFDLYKVLHAPPFGGDAPHDAAGTGDNPRPQLGSEDAIHGATEVRPVYKVITEKDEAQIATNNFVRSLSDAFLMVSSAADPFHGDADTHNKVRVKPHPDPHPQRAKETAWMSPEQIRSEVLQPSHRWLEAGSGTLGKLYLEVGGILLLVDAASPWLAATAASFDPSLCLTLCSSARRNRFCRVTISPTSTSEKLSGISPTPSCAPSLRMPWSRPRSFTTSSRRTGCRGPTGPSASASSTRQACCTWGCSTTTWDPCCRTSRWAEPR